MVNVGQFFQVNEFKLLIQQSLKKVHNDLLNHQTLNLAPNYCDQRGNDGAYLTIRPDADLVPVPTEFKAVSHPPCQPMMYANPMLRMAGVI